MEKANREAWERHIRESHHPTLTKTMPSGSKPREDQDPRNGPISAQEPRTSTSRFRPARPAKASGSRMKQNLVVEIPVYTPFSKLLSATKITRSKPTPASSQRLPISRESTSESTLNVAQALCDDDQSLLSTPENHDLPQAEVIVAINQPTTSQPGVSTSETQEKPSPRPSPSPLPGPPAKRQKVCSTRSKHWEAERTIIVQVQDTEFRLNTSRLEELSGWFKDTLSGEHGSQIIDLDVTRVSAHDFEILLDSLNKFSTFEMKSPSFDEITAIMRAATALRFEAEAAWAARRLQGMWSSHLADVNHTRRPHAIEMIATARQCNLNAVIKPAFYELVRSDIAVEVTKDDIKNGSLKVEDLLAIQSARQEFSARWLALADSHDSLNRFPHCGDAKKVPLEVPAPLQGIVDSGSVAQRIKKFENGGIGEIMTLRHPREQGAVTRCISADAGRLKQAHTKLVHDSGMLKRYIFDPVCGLKALADAPWAKEGLCGTCVQARRAVWRAERERLWAEMDEWFGGVESTT